ncbi:DUF4445 domain-containing protein [bacterium]|nr:DUF4445 domain-containing protein [bacterium]MBU1152409.1 DUF4445 domain-containing protein [bacterium]MBU1782317.1 DUF4445 domain-containing protein [bacterium]
MKEYKVIFYPNQREVSAPEGENLLRIAAAAGLYITASCGGNGSCGKCKVIIESGEVEEGISERLTPDEIKKDYRLACASKIKSHLVVRIPVESQISDKRVLEGAVSKRLVIQEQLKTLTPDGKIDPMVKKYHLELPLPTLEDNIDDFSRIKRALKMTYDLHDCSISLSCLKALPMLLRKANFKVTLSLLKDKDISEIVNIEEGDQTKEHYCLAIDIGTTSIYARLINLFLGEEVATTSDFNAQIAYGEDIISRIVYSQKGEGLKILQEAVVKTINELINSIVKEAKITEEKITYLVIAGNTTMEHLFLGVNPKYIREAPYVPAVNFLYQVKASEVGLKLFPHTPLYLLPGVSSYVGGDITAGVLATGITQSTELTLYVDIGTNGEVVLGNKDWLVATACSAGPAFEGGTIKHGMRATLGAIEQVEIDKNFEPMIITIGHRPPKGICGAGLISLVAELLEAGIINQKGKFNLGIKETPRIRKNKAIKEYVLAFKDEAGIDEDIVITESDIDDLIRAKGAMFAGIFTLLNSVGVEIADISKIIISGNLGFHLEIEKAITIGLLPEVDYAKFIFIGNGSLLGATISACSKKMLKQAKEIASSITNIELSDNPKFMEEYIAALFLPHTNDQRFPQVYKRLLS